MINKFMTKYTAVSVCLLLLLTAFFGCGAEPAEAAAEIITALDEQIEAETVSAREYPGDVIGAGSAQIPANQTENPPVTDAPADPNVVTVSVGTQPPPQDTPVQAPPSQNPTDYSAIAPKALLAKTEDAGQEYIDNIIFVGDSTTYGLKPYKMLKDGKETKQVWTPKSGTLTLSYATISKIVYPDDGSEITIAEAAKLKQPKMMVLTLGVNGVSFMEESFFKAEYSKLIALIKEASPETIIILQSIFPVAKNYTSLSQINNTKISAANKWIAAVAESEGVYFLDTYSALVNAEGWLPDEYQNGDGIHLNSAGFTVELNNIRTHKVP
jgi:lysophospholipase L1-like esterase